MQLTVVVFDSSLRNIKKNSISYDKNGFFFVKIAKTLSCSIELVWEKLFSDLILLDRNMKCYCNFQFSHDECWLDSSVRRDDHILNTIPNNYLAYIKIWLLLHIIIYILCLNIIITMYMFKTYIVQCCDLFVHTTIVSPFPDITMYDFHDSIDLSLIHI